MAVEYEHALGVHVADRYRAAAETIHPGITADPAWPSVAQRLHLAEGAGLDVAAILQPGRADGRLHRRPLRHPASWCSDSTASSPPPSGTRGGAAAAGAGLAGGRPAGRGCRPPWDSYLPARYAEMAERIIIAGHRGNRTKPARVADAASATAPGRDEAMRQAVAYRAVYAIDGDDPLGPEPAQHTRQHQAWTAATTRDPGQPQRAAVRRRATRPAAPGQLTRPPSMTPSSQSRRGPTRTA